MKMAARRKTAILLPLALLLANFLNMVGIVVLPKIIDPSQFALFSLASSSGLFLIAVLYEWNRITIMRYSVAVDPEEMSRRRSVLKRANIVTSIVLLVISIVAYSFSSNWYALVFSMACLFAVSQAMFEARQAFFRADFLDRNYAVSLVARALLGFSLLCAIGYLSNDAFFVMCGWAASYVVVLFFTRSLAGKSVPRPMDWKTLRFLLGFGVGVAMAAIANTLLSPLVRLLAAEFITLSDSGKLMLAMDISQKIVGVIGVSINILTLQATFRAREFGEHEVVRQRIGMQLSVVVATILPAVVGFIAVQDGFTFIFIPDAYRDVFLPNIAWCMVAAGLLGFRAFALDSIFIVLGRPYTGLVGPLVTAAVTIASVFALTSLEDPSALLFSKALCFGVLAGSISSIIVARRLFHFSLDLPNLIRITVAAITMYASIQLVRFDNAIVDFAASVAVGAFVYGAILLASNAFSSHKLLRLALARVKRGNVT
jgi:O-antigen/teichoic acid export membrane protein